MPMMNAWHYNSRCTSNIKKNEFKKAFLNPVMGDGVLIFDEVRVQGNVVWNSKNNQIIGLAMNQNDLASLHDIYAHLAPEQMQLETQYILQFIWRDLTSKFDIVGPYYTSNSGFDTKFTMACFHDALLLFETYKFEPLLSLEMEPVGTIPSLRSCVGTLENLELMLYPMASTSKFQPHS